MVAMRLWGGHRQERLSASFVVWSLAEWFLGLRCYLGGTSGVSTVITKCSVAMAASA